MIINLRKEFFTEKEFVIAENGTMRAVAFRYSTGVCALRVENEKGYFIILPYQGQQIWRASFCGQDLTMKSTFEEPVSGVSYLRTYGGFVYHCGMTSIGAADANHLQHGEIPNIDYNSAYIECGTENGRDYMAVGGSVDYNIGFTLRYIFSPKCTLYADASVLKFDIELKNMRQTPLEYAYLCHINFAPVYGAKLYYNADCLKVHRVVPDAMPDEDKAKLNSQLDRLEADIHSADVVGEPDQFYQPEICCTMKYRGDRGYTLQYAKGEGACYVTHTTEELPYAIRWISRLETEDSMGMVLPSTGEHFGYEYLKQQGQLKVLEPYGTLNFTIEAGWIDDDKAKEVIDCINKMQ